MQGLVAGVHGAVSGEDLVLLDLRIDEYACFPRAAPGRSGGVATLADLSGEALDALEAAGLLDPSDVRSPLPPVATRDLRNHPHSAPSPADLYAAVGAVVDLRRKGADPAVRDLLPLIGSVRDGGTAQTLDAAAVFANLLPWLPVRSQCLHRSAALIAYLRRRRLGATWMFGVRTWPFRAHCWVQTGDICLNDDHEALQAYSPILAVS